MKISDDRLIVAIHTPRMRGIGQIPSERITEEEVSEMARELLWWRKADRWIPVDSGILPALESTEDNGEPKYSRTVQMINAAGDQRTGIMWCVNGKISWEAYTDEAFDPVAWRPLPAPPEVSNG